MCVCALHCAQLLHTIVHITDLLIFILTLQTIIIERRDFRTAVTNAVYAMYSSEGQVSTSRKLFLKITNRFIMQHK